jgi:CheY-like chemotaxis protein
MGTPSKILLVEDEALNTLFITLQVKKAGYKLAATATSGEAAVAYALREKFDLVLMDINLSGPLNGIEAAIEIKACQDVPIIFISGYSDSTIRRDAAAAKPFAFLVKPISGLELASWLMKAIGPPAGA